MVTARLGLAFVELEGERVGQAHFRSGHSPNFRAVIQEYGLIDV